MRPLVASMSHAPSWSIWSPVPWTQSAPAHSVKSSAQTTLSLDNLALVTTGPRVTTPRVPSWSTQFSMLSAKKPNHAIASRLIVHLSSISNFLKGFPTYPLPRWWYRFRYGNTLDLKDPRGVPRPCHEHILRCPITKGL